MKSNQSVRSWLRAQRRAPVKTREVFPRKKVVSLSAWRYAQACRDFEIADNRVRYAEKALGFNADAEDADRQKLIDDVTAEVIERIVQARRQADAANKKSQKRKLREK